MQLIWAQGKCLDEFVEAVLTRDRGLREARSFIEASIFIFRVVLEALHFDDPFDEVGRSFFFFFPFLF